MKQIILLGIILDKKIGDKVNIGEVLAYIHSNKEDVEEAKKKIIEAYKIDVEKPEEYKHILNII